MNRRAAAVTTKRKYSPAIGDSDDETASEPQQAQVSNKDDDDDDDDSPPPAKKLLKDLLVQEVDRALRDLQNETSLVPTTARHRGASLIPEFDPDNEDTTVTAWLKKIEQLGNIHGWDDQTKSYHLQDKLRGQARKWYNRLDEYDHTWEEWRQMLLRAFPKHRDYANMLEEMINRRKLQNESMTKYYQEKVARCFRCKLSDVATVSCIIRGLPPALQSNARAFQCERPDELYEGFLSAFDDYRPHNAEPRSMPHTAAATTARPIPTGERKPVNPETDPCPRCKKTGHLLRNCTLPDLRSCFKCGLKGHIAPRCPNNSQNNGLKENSDVKQINFVQNYNDIYKKTAKVNGIFVKSYIDTGSQVNVITRDIIQLLSLRPTETSTVLKGFSGGFVTSRGKVEFNLQIDNIDLTCTAFVCDIDMNDIHLLIGQPVINHEGVSLLVRNNTVSLAKNEDFLLTIESEKPQKFNVVTVNKECLLPGTSIIKVNVVGNENHNDVITPARHFEMHDQSYSLPATALRGSSGYLKVVNTGSSNIEWAPGAVLVRAESYYAEPTPSSRVSHFNTSTVPSHLAKSVLLCHNDTIGGVALNEICVGNLGDDDRTKLFSLLSKYKCCFASDTFELGCSNLVDMKIQLTNDQPIYRRPYRLSHMEQEIVNTKVRELLNAGIIKESESSYASPVILVKKKNGDSRLCVDYRALNAVTIKDRYPLPNIEDHISKLTGKKYFTCLDMSQSYHQLKINPADTYKTAFVTTQGHYEYMRVPFGLANAPSVFMRFMNKIVNSLQSTNLGQGQESATNPEVLAFLDDLLLPSYDVTSGIRLLDSVLGKFEQENLKLNMKKCAFLLEKITYLGHDISFDGIQPCESKLTSVSKFPTPSNVHEIRQFVGLCSYFRKFIFNFAIIARPLTELTQKGVCWIWGNKQQNSFDELKKKLCEKPVLALYDRKLPTEIHTDACKLGIAGILLQQQYDGALKPVMYFSRVTSREEAMYHSYELETLAVVESLRKFRIYVVGIHIKVVTDCTAVRETLTKRDLVPRIARWWMMIQDYDLQVEYRPGERMRHVDALSRNPIDSVNVNRLEVTDWFFTVQYQDEKTKRIIELLKNGCTDTDITNNYSLSNDRLYRKTLNGNRLVVPDLARWRILQMHHDEVGHVGISRCSELIKNDYWFPKMSRFIKKYVSSCLHCAYGKGEYGKREGMLHSIPKPTEPMRTVHIDHLGPFCKTKKGYQYIFVLTDSFSKFVMAEPARTVNSVETIRILKRLFSYFGYPNRVISDHGKAFTSRYFKRFATQKQFRHTLNAIACPRANGQVERTNRTLLDALRSVGTSESANNWDNDLPQVIWGINNTCNNTTGYKPYDLMFAQAGRSVCDVGATDRPVEPVQTRRRNAARKTKLASAKMKQHYDKRRKSSTVYKKGDLVLWKQAPTSSASRVNTKLDDIYSGPYVVVQVLGNDRYRIRSIKGMRGYKSFIGLVASDSLRPYRSVVDIPDSASSSDEQLETEDLIDLLES